MDRYQAVNQASLRRIP